MRGNYKNVIRWYDKKTFSNYFNGDYFDCDARRNNKFFIGLYDQLGGNPVKRLNNNEPISPIESHDTMFYTLTNEEISYIKSMPECYVSFHRTTSFLLLILNLGQLVVHLLRLPSNNGG